jgi:MFS family permease
MTIVGALQCMAGGSFVALNVVWCDQVLGVGTSGWRFGLVFSAWSVGAIIASLALPRLLRRRNAAAITLAALPVSAVLGVVVPFARSWVVGALGLFLWSCVYTLVAVNSISYRQEVTPEPLLGRVNTAGRMLAWGLGWTTGALVGGVLSDILGVQTAMSAMAALGIVACVVAWTSPLRESRGASEQDRREAGALDEADPGVGPPGRPVVLVDVQGDDRGQLVEDGVDDRRHRGGAEPLTAVGGVDPDALDLSGVRGDGRDLGLEDHLVALDPGEREPLADQLRDS